jgi:glutamine cyclotransferase
MLFGLKINHIIHTISITLTIALTGSCKDDPAAVFSNFVTPEAGLNIASGKEFPVKIQFGKDKKIDSVVYYMDSVKIQSTKDTTGLNYKTEGFSLGSHIIMAKIFSNGQAEDLTSNVNILANKAPDQYTYKIIKTLPHDTSSYIEGLEYENGYFFESKGDTGHSGLQKVEVSSGKIVQKIDLDKKYFGEGITIIGDKILQLTYQDKLAFVYDKATFKKLKEFPYTIGEGWGLAFDGEKILNSVGTNIIYFLDKDNYKQIGSLSVYDNEGAITNINELEIIDGKIYANVYLTNSIIIINPKTGAVESKIDLSGLLPSDYFKSDIDKTNNVLNGIAYDKEGKRLFVTGKKWPHIFEIKLIKK